ncbi:hypothetical protein [Alteromonas gracilis]|uniref:hypothetical protein n=1 Tax=Alteromonas gracilis TaxID=1479524 RepID=UPI0030CCA06A
MDRSQFSAHGEVKAAFDEHQKVLFIDLVGPFNLEFMRKYEMVVGAQRAKITSPCWGSLVNINGLALAPMTATSSAHAIVDKAVAKGLVATAIVFNETEGEELQKKFWTQLYEGSTLPFAFFSSRGDAIEWLSEHIYTCIETNSACYSTTSL